MWGEHVKASEVEPVSHTMRPKTLTASSLLQRAGIGLLILVVGTVVSVWLYDASLKANAFSQLTPTQTASR